MADITEEEKMDNEIKIAPSILSADFAAMGAAVEKLEKCGADMIHCDVMDGTFVPKITFGGDMIAAVRGHTLLPLDVHLMVVNPQNQVRSFAEAGANIITVHREACGENIKNVLRLIKNCGARAGVVINPDTPLKEVYDCLELCDLLLVMSVYPGLGGQKFIERVLPKVEEARRIFDAQGVPKDIEIDGGITEANVRRIKDAGANVIVAGSTVFNAPDMAKTIANLRTL
ncbi:MAG TPA: ribulose-phosphate 3-epimerase [Candidatus Borkfalkia stercoripullorum]|nr:ribulose-phosphate 3-epimerase [Candidatus Borkfalkia stercoripullorum]